MLEAIDVNKAFGDVVALERLNLRVEPGEVVCLLGANGAGKSTTLNLFLGFLQPDKGSIRVRDIDPYIHPNTARRMLAYIPEKVALYDTMTGLENLRFFDRLSQGQRSDTDLLASLETAGLEPSRATQPISTYSKGMCQKVGLAIAIAKGADVLLLDEPMSGLDPKAARDFAERLNELKRQGCAVLMTTHDIFRAKDCATRIGIMRAGNLLEMLDADGLEASDIERLYLHHMGREVA